MGAGGYIGAHSKVFISAGGTRWEVPDGAANEPNDLRRKRWDEEIATASDGNLGRITKEVKSFLSMCVFAFHRDLLTESNPKPPAGLRKQVARAGGNKSWIVSDQSRLNLFADFYYKKVKPKP